MTNFPAAAFKEMLLWNFDTVLIWHFADELSLVTQHVMAESVLFYELKCLSI